MDQVLHHCSSLLHTQQKNALTLMAHLFSLHGLWMSVVRTAGELCTPLAVSTGEKSGGQHAIESSHHHGTMAPAGFYQIQ